MLKRSSTSNPYCVPAAAALLLDITVDEACALLKEELGDTAISGVFYPLVLKLLVGRGFSYVEKLPQRTDLSSGTFLWTFQRHVGVSINGIYYDNQNPTGITPTKQLKNKLQGIYEIRK